MALPGPPTPPATVDITPGAARCEEAANECWLFRSPRGAAACARLPLASTATASKPLAAHLALDGNLPHLPDRPLITAASVPADIPAPFAQAHAGHSMLKTRDRGHRMTERIDQPATANEQAEPLAPRRELLEGPGVAVGVAEEDKPAPRLFVDLAGLDAVVDQVLAGGRSILDHHLDALLRPWRHLGHPGAHHHRARRPWRRELHEPQVLADLVIMVSVEAHLVYVEGFGAVNVGHRDGDKLDLPVHTLQRTERVGHPTGCVNASLPLSFTTAGQTVDDLGRGVLSAAKVTHWTAYHRYQSPAGLVSVG